MTCLKKWLHSREAPSSGQDMEDLQQFKDRVNNNFVGLQGQVHL